MYRGVVRVPTNSDRPFIQHLYPKSAAMQTISSHLRIFSNHTHIQMVETREVGVPWSCLLGPEQCWCPLGQRLSPKSEVSWHFLLYQYKPGPSIGAYLKGSKRTKKSNWLRDRVADSILFSSVDTTEESKGILEKWARWVITWLEGQQQPAAFLLVTPPRKELIGSFLIHMAFLLQGTCWYTLHLSRLI